MNLENRQFIKEDWIINNQNIFGLGKDINLSFSSIQYEILNQLGDKKINLISDYLVAEIDINKEIQLTKGLTIEKIFSEFLVFENINPLKQTSLNCYLILSYLQLSLFKEYTQNKHKNILMFSEYKKEYNLLLNNFLSANIDTNEQDFINEELMLSDSMIKELHKPIYNIISPLNEVLDKPCEFKKNLLNSIDKRKKILNQKNQSKSFRHSTEQYKNTSNNKVDLKRFQIHNALYTYYLHQCQYLPYFELHGDGKIKAINKIVEENNYGSVKSFQIKYNFILKKENRISANQITNLEFVIELLENFPKAKKLALEELKLAELKR